MQSQKGQTAMKFYHATPHSFPAGAKIYPQGNYGYKGFRAVVFLSNRPLVHATLVGRSVKRWNLYEVRVASPPIWVNGDEEYVSETACEIVRLVRTVSTHNWSSLPFEAFGFSAEGNALLKAAGIGMSVPRPGATPHSQ